MDKVLLSIVIPCYNNFSIMGKALEMFENNKAYRDKFEIVIVDDCSTDDSYYNLVEYSKKTELNIRIFKNDENSGPGNTRNNGISKSVGQYITFLDADDYFKNNYFDLIIPKLDGCVDCLVYDYVTINQDNTERRFFSFFKKVDAGLVDKKIALVFIKGSTCGKVYRRQIINDNSIVFLDLKRNEDMPFTKMAISKCDSILYIDEPLYCYVQNNNSLMHNRELAFAGNAINAFYYLYDNLNSIYLDEVEGIFILEYLYSTALTNLQLMDRRQWIKYINESEKVFEDYFSNRYFPMYSLRIRLIVRLIHEKKYYLVKMFANIRNFIKRIYL